MQILCKWARRNSIWCHNVCSFRREKEAQTIKRVSRRNANGEMSLVNCRWRGGGRAGAAREGNEAFCMFSCVVSCCDSTGLKGKLMNDLWQRLDSGRLLLRSKHGRLLVWLPTYRDGSQYGKKKRKISKLTRLHLSRNVAENERHCQAQRAQQTILHFLPSGRQLGSCFATKIIRKWFILPRTLIHSFDLNKQPRNFQI